MTKEQKIKLYNNNGGCSKSRIIDIEDILN